MWWRHKKERSFSLPHGKLEVFSRHCYFSSVSQHKKRFDGFSREKCHRNFLDTIDFNHTLRAGFIGTYGNRWANLSIGNANLLHKKTIKHYCDGNAWLMQIIIFLMLGLQVIPSKIIVNIIV